MAITHATIKAPGQTLAAIADWNAQHVGDAVPTVHDNTKHTVSYIVCGDVPGCEADPVYSAWIAGPPNISEFTNDVGYITSWGPEADPVYSAWIAGPPNVSEFTNDAGYLAVESDPVFVAWDKDHDDLSNVTSDQHHAAVTVTDTATVDLTLAGQQISADVIYQMSITADASGLKLSGDAAAPGNSKYYGTNGAGAKGFFDLPGAAAAVWTYLGAGTISGAAITLDNIPTGYDYLLFLFHTKADSTGTLSMKFNNVAGTAYSGNRFNLVGTTVTGISWASAASATISTATAKASWDGQILVHQGWLDGSWVTKARFEVFGSVTENTRGTTQFLQAEWADVTRIDLTVSSGNLLNVSPSKTFLYCFGLKRV